MVCYELWIIDYELFLVAGSFNGRTPAFGAGYSWFESKPRSIYKSCPIGHFFVYTGLWTRANFGS